MDLKAKIEAKQSTNDNTVPVSPLDELRRNARAAQNKETSEKKPKKFIKYILLSFASLLLVTALLLYIPQFFVSDEQETSEFDEWDFDALAARQRYISDNPDMDFDGDGVTNYRELEQNTNVYFKDSDFDGVSDMKDIEPNVYGEMVYDALISQGHSVKSAFKMNDVVMWADDKDSFIKGGVLKTVSGGYHFNNFVGWANFPSEGTAYKYIDGVHTKLEYRETENAWYIDEDCDVYLIKDEPELVYKYECFGKNGYVYDAWGRFLNTVLPEKGFITCRELWLADTFISIQETKTTKRRTLDESQITAERFAFNNNNLLDLMTVYQFIDKDISVFASIVDPEYGEMIVQIYGYNANGDLLISMDENGSGVLKINPIAAKTLSSDNNIIASEWFEFEGCGFDSKRGQTISFFATAGNTDDEFTGAENPSDKDNVSEDSSADSSEESSQPETSDDEPDSVILNPLNGTQVVDGKTYYYINGKKVTNAYIRVTNGTYETVESPSVTGAFYVDADGIKLTGLYTHENKYYIQTENGFVKEQFVRIDGEEYEISSPGNKNVYFFNINCTPITGWFTHNGKKYYASKDFKVLYNCFVKTENGSFRYLDYKGNICTNKLVTVDGVEILLDDNGLIINYQQVKSIVNKYARS